MSPIGTKPAFGVKDQLTQISLLSYISNCKTPKISDARKLSCNTPKIQIKGPNLRVFLQKDSNGIANSEDPDQSDLGLHCLPRPICPKT